MKKSMLLLAAMASVNCFALLPQSVVCVKKEGLRESTLIMHLSANEGVVPNYNLTYVVNGKAYLHFETSLTKSDQESFKVEGYINDPNRSDVIGYAGYDLKSGEGYYMEAANHGMSPMPGTSFPSCKAYKH